MTTEQYRIVAAHIARHCMNHLQFVYDSVKLVYAGAKLRQKDKIIPGEMFADMVERVTNLTF